MLIVQADNIFTLKQEIMSQAKDKALNGDFDVNGSFNYKKICDWILEQCKLKIADFYPNGFADISIQQLGTLYDAMVKADINNTKKAALDYCNALIAKDTANNSDDYAKVIAEVFGGSNYEQIIKNTPTYQITDFMNTLKTKVGAVKIKEVVNFSDKTNEIFKNTTYTSNAKGMVTPTYYVNNAGDIIFVNFAKKDGVFNDTKNTDLCNKASNIRTAIETEYKALLDSLKMSAKEKQNLFNIALFTTLSDPTIVLSQYESIDFSRIAEFVVKNYVKILEKLSMDENARKFVASYPTENLLAGRNTSCIVDSLNADVKKGMSKYYKDNSTQGSDDAISIKTRTTDLYNDGFYSGSIVILNSGAAGDDNAVNNAMKAILKDYITAYSKYIDGNRIVELFRNAQEIAYSNMDDSQNTSIADANGTRLYGWGEGSGTKDMSDSITSSNYYTVGTVLINVMYEMEKLIAKELLM